MTRAWALLLLVLLMPGSALSDSSNLEGGVFIAHHPPGLQYTSGQDWCARYFQEFAIDSCSEQNNRIDLDGNQGQSSVWFVLAAWAEEKEWCGAEFGFAQYDSTIYAFISSGPCFPDGSGGGLEIPTAGWPGPNAGVALSISGAPWSGNFVPVYFFAGYAYYQGEIPLAANPASGFGGTANCETPPQSWAATAFGAMGIFQDGTSACPEELDGGGGGLDGGMQPDGAEGYGGYEPEGGQDWGDGEEGCIDYRDFMHWVGNVNPPGSCQDVAIAGDYAYVASGSSGLQVVNVYVARSPVVVGSVDTPSFANAVCVADGYAYVADGLKPEVAASLQVVDVSDPGSPEVVGSIEMPGGGDAIDVAVSGNYAYVVINTASPGSPGVQVVDITSPASPQLGPLVQLSAPWSIAVSGNYLYVADNFEGLEVIFMSEQGPQIVGSYNTPEIVARGVALSGSFAYVADAEYGLLVIDVSDPANPSLEGSVETPSAACELAVSGDQAYLSDCESGLVAIDIANPADPRITGRMGTLASPHGVACTDSYVYVAAETAGLDVIERANSEDPPLSGGVDTPGLAGGVAVSGGYAYVADGSSGLQVVDMSGPTIVGSVDTPGSARAVAVAGGYAYVADGSYGLQVIDISDPGDPGIVAYIDTPGSARGVALAEYYACVADSSGGLQVINISNPRVPAIEGSLSIASYEALAVAASGNYAYVAARSPGLPAGYQMWVIDISTPGTPSLEGSAPIEDCGGVYGVAAAAIRQHIYAYVGSGPASVRVFDVTDPVFPSQTCSAGLRRPARGLVVSGELLYVADEAGGLQVLSISDPDAPVLLGGRDRLGDALGVATSDGCVCVAAGSEGLRLLPKQWPVFAWEAYWVQLQNAQPFGLQVQQDSNGNIVVEMTLDGFYAIPEEIDGTTFYHISLPGEPLRMVAEAPELPFVPRSLLVSDDQRMVATVDSAVYVDLLALPVAPSKGPLPMGVDPDSVAYVFGPAYTDSAFYPAAPESLGAPFILRDFRGQVLQLNPFQAYPLDSTLRVYTYLKVSVTPSGPDTASVIQRSGPPATIDRQFAMIYQKFFSNYPAIEVLGYVPETEDQDLLIVIPWNCTYCDEIDDFAEWKESECGLVTDVVSTTEIGSATFEGIRQYIRTRYLQDHIAYVLLVGDADQIPPRVSTLNNQANTPADPPYTFMNDEDHYPDIFVGRFSARNASQLNTQIERTMAYGESQGLWLTRAFGMASHLDDLDGVFDFPPPYGSNPEVMADWLGRLQASSLYTTTHLYSNEDAPPEGQVTYLLDQLNQGLSLMLVSDHGCVDGWDDDFPHQGVPPEIMRREVVGTDAWLHNTGALPLIHAQSCDVGGFTDTSYENECFAESWMWEQRDQDGAPQGAIAAYMPGGRIAQRGPQYAQFGTILALLDDGSPSIGQLVYFGAVFMLLQGVEASNFEMWNLFGDPSLIFRKSGGPQSVEVTGNSELRPAEVFRIGPSPSSGPVRVHFTTGGESTGSHAELRVFDLCGRCVRTLLAPAGARGVQSMLWDGKDNRGNKVPSGAYFCRLAVGGKEITRQIVMVR